MSKVEQQLMFFVGIAILALGIYVVIGWLLTIPAMVNIVPGSPVMVCNTAICFIASGLLLTLKPTLDLNENLRPLQWLKLILALGLMALPLLILVEILGHYDWGIDWASRHRLVLDRNLTPGRMAPNSCVAFVLIGAAFLVDGVKNLRIKKTALIILGGFTLLTGVSSLLSYLMDLEWLYSFAQRNRMAMPTAIGLSFIGFVLMMAGTSRARQITAENRHEDLRLTRIAVLIMIALSLASGLAGFIVLKQGTDQALRDQLQQKAINNADSFTAAFERRYTLADKLFSFPVFAEDLATLSTTPNDIRSLEHIKKVGTILLSMGFSGLQIQNNDKKSVYSLGKIRTHPGLSVPIKIGDQKASLLWSDGLVLHIERPIIKHGVPVGTSVTEQPMTGLERLLHNIQFSGHTTDSGLCHRNGDFFECFPSRLVPTIAYAPMLDHGQPSFPMAHALLGEVGIVYANDIRGIPVLAAYTPVGDTGLGLVIKIDTTEIYGFVRDKLHILLAVLALFVVVGTSVLRLSIQPLASRLVRSEQKMREAHDVLEKAQQKLTYMAQYDVLTGLPNRSFFMDRLSLATLRAERSRKPLALMFLDLDRFKLINDTHGHGVGDALLKQFAERLTASVRKTDTVSRLAGDEFTIILEELSNPEHDAQIIAEKIIQATMQVFAIEGQNITITASIGVVVSLSGNNNIDELIHAADTEMYKAKNKGKNQFSLGQA